VPTVDDLRDEIRRAVGRHERIESTAFTKEALAAICDAADHDVGTGRLPPKAEMRAAVLRNLGVNESADPAAFDRPFRKAELEAIAASLGEESGGSQ
jgi:hypothetical protein